MVPGFTRFDVVDYLRDEEDMLNYVQAAMEEGDDEILLTALSDVARARLAKAGVASSSFSLQGSTETRFVSGATNPGVTSTLKRMRAAAEKAGFEFVLRRKDAA